MRSAGLEAKNSCRNIVIRRLRRDERALTACCMPPLTATVMITLLPSSISPSVRRGCVTPAALDDALIDRAERRWPRLLNRADPHAIAKPQKRRRRGAVLEQTDRTPFGDA